MLGQAAGFAFLAALSPTALLVAAVYLGSARPRQAILSYLAGGALTATVMSVVVLMVLRAGHLQLRSAQTPRYGLRLGLGVAILGAALVAARRKPAPPDSAKHGKGIVSRLTAEPAPVTALLAGLLIFTPSLTFVAAVQVIATARAGDLVTALGLLMVVIIYVMIVWLPFLAYLVAPGRTTRLLRAFNSWLRAHGRLITTCALALAGTLLAINGLAGLIGR